MPIIPAAWEVYYRDGDGPPWDLAMRVPKRFDAASYEWGARPAMAGFWPRASLLWPVCERGRLSRGNNRPLTGAGPSESFGTQTGRCPGLRGVGLVRFAGHRWSSSTGRAVGLTCTPGARH